jgi:hypothetical protein
MLLKLVTLSAFAFVSFVSSTHGVAPSNLDTTVADGAAEEGDLNPQPLPPIAEGEYGAHA